MSQRLQGVLVLGLLLGLVFGVILGLIGWQERTLYAKGTPAPLEVRAADLVAKGPPDNVHLKLTDVAFSDRYVVEKKGGKWNRVWLPLYPAGSDGNPRDVRVLIKTFNVADEGQLAQFAQRQSVTGVFTNDIHSLGSAERGHLEKLYPGVDFESVLVLEQGRSFPTQNKINLLLGGGAALIALALACAVTLFVLHRRRSAAAPPWRPDSPATEGGHQPE